MPNTNTISPKSVITIGWEDFVLDTDDAMKVMAVLALVLKGELLKSEYVEVEGKHQQVQTLHPVSDFRPALRHLSKEAYATAKVAGQI